MCILHQSVFESCVCIIVIYVLEYTYHENCIREWLKQGRIVQRVEESYHSEEMFLILVDEDTNQPSDSLIEVHK